MEIERRVESGGGRESVERKTKRKGLRGRKRSKARDLKTEVQSERL